MKMRIAILVLLGLARSLAAFAAATTPKDLEAGGSEGILQSIENATVAQTREGFSLKRKDAHAPVVLNFTGCLFLGVQYQEKQWWVLPISVNGAQADLNTALWVLPLEATSKENAWHIEPQDGRLHVTKTDTGLKVTTETESLTLSKTEARPRSDPFGHRFSFEISGGPELEQALAAFYWGTMLPSVVEKTMAASFPYSSGYVLSTLNVNSYAGSYPAVDHEFQIKGRLAMGSEADLDIVKRMIELQFQLMKDDPEHLYRAPTSVQPDGRREYHVRRNSEDNHQNAAMFPLTGNIEVIEEAWHYYEARKDPAWLRSNIDNLEQAAGWILLNTDQYGRVWSDVYYEDQVMKDGRETEAQAFAAHAFELLARMERLSQRENKAAVYTANATMMAGVLVAPIPMGYWDTTNQRFIDWVDRNGRVHDHIHLLANELPVAFGYASADQAAAVQHLIKANDGEFERFPTFLAARIADYDRSEIGDGGPYDLCAAGRYWYWDAAFRGFEQQNAILLEQLKSVAAEGAKDNYFMSERYDMDDVYYVDGKNYHGAEKYYEYPNVFAAVLIEQYLGLSIPADADVAVAPHLHGYGSVEFDVPEYAVRYSYSENGFVLKNLSDRARRFNLDLSALDFHAQHFRQAAKSGDQVVDARSTLTLSSQEEVRWTPQR